MKVYGAPQDVKDKCPACGADKGVYCGFDINGPLVHERRVKKNE